MRIFFSVGEPSGDEHAAHLIGELRKRCPELKPYGFGGPQMQQSGCVLLYRLTDLAVMGFLRVVPLIGKFLRVANLAKKEFRENPPDAVVLVDFPGFNWHIAKAASKAGIPVYYYMPPQLWAWLPHRIRKVRKYIDRVLCALPFEHEWYESRDVAATYVGHPFFDEVHDKTLDDQFVEQQSKFDGRIISVLPGSRRHEVERNFPLMVDIATRLAKKHDDIRFVVACYNDEQRMMAEEIHREHDGAAPMDFFVDRTSELIEVADCCLIVSGSVSLELLARGKPAVVLYRLHKILHLLRPSVVKCKWVTLTNLIANRELMPEFVSSGDPERDTAKITQTLSAWLADPTILPDLAQQTRDLAEATVVTGASGRAADTILGAADDVPPSVRAA